MPTIATFEAQCAACSSVFAAPHVGDFAYGEFVLYGQLGTVHAHLVAIGNDVWEFVRSALPDADVDTLQEVVARVADPVDGQRLTMSHVCPNCASTDWAYWAGNASGPRDIPSATFNAFSVLPPAHQRRRVLDTYHELVR